MFFRLISGALAGILVVMVAAGCGSDSEASPSVTKAQFVKAGNAVCDAKEKQRVTQINAYNEKVNANPKGESRAEESSRTEYLLARIYIPSMKEQLQGLEGLDVPEADEAQIETMLQNLSKGISDIEAEGLGAVYGSKPLKAFEAEASKYGLNCIS